jgi:hypothetical protein
VLLYQGWTYYVFRHRVEGEPTILDEPDAGEPGPEPEPAH